MFENINSLDSDCLNQLEVITGDILKSHRHLGETVISIVV